MQALYIFVELRYKDKPKRIVKDCKVVLNSSGNEMSSGRACESMPSFFL